MNICKMVCPLVFLVTIFVSSLAHGGFVSKEELIVGPSDESPIKNTFYSYCTGKEKTPCSIVEALGRENDFALIEMAGTAFTSRVYHVKYKILPGNLGVIIQYKNDSVQYKIDPELKRDLSYKLVQTINNQLTILDIDCKKLNSEYLNPMIQNKDITLNHSQCTFASYQTLFAVFADIAALKPAESNMLGQRYALSPTTEKNAIAAYPQWFPDTPEGKAWDRKQAKELARLKAKIEAGKRKLAAIKKKEEESSKSSESYASSPGYFKMRDEQQKEQDRLQKQFDNVIRYSDFQLR